MLLTMGLAARRFPLQRMVLKGLLRGAGVPQSYHRPNCSADDLREETVSLDPTGRSI